MRKQELKELNELFNEVKDANEDDFSSFVQVPDGNYMAKVDDLEVTESKKGNPMFVLTFEITDGEFKGMNHKQFIMLSANDELQLKRNINRYATTVKKLGIDTSKGLSGTFDNLGVGLGKKVLLKIETTVAKNGNSYTNTSFEVK